MARRLTLIAVIGMAFSSTLYPQSLSQVVRGRIYDNTTREPLPFSTIVVLDSDPLLGTMADGEGFFVLKGVGVGRISIRVDRLGYDSYVIGELLVSSGKELVLEVPMQQSTTQLHEVMVRVNKDAPLNSMAMLSGRQFTVEETQRYAGGLDDPARLVTSFAGVASPSVASSGISVRGNNPSGLLWRIEGVEVPNPNHFADLTIAGGGMVTAISSQMMGNSDFFTGAFPAEYGNASSGVFDIKLNTGNASKRQYTVQAGLIGLDFGTQGPFKQGGNATYNMNYRYSTMALVAPVLPDDAGILKYQDLCFKTNFPTPSSGTFCVWGIGALDGVDLEARDSACWKANGDRDNSQTSLNMFAAGLSHKISLSTSSFLSTTLSASGNGLSHNEQRLDYGLRAHPHSKADNQMYRYALQSAVSSRFGKKHSNKTGFNFQHLRYALDVERSPLEGVAPVQIVNQTGHSGLWQVYSQSKINWHSRWTLNLGLNTQYFLLNDNLSIEPRVGIQYQLNPHHQLAVAYGLHSRMETLSVYFIEDGVNKSNKDLKFMKAAHYILSYGTKLNDHLRLTVEPYYQQLSNVPVSPDNYLSTINNDHALFFDEILCSQGKGHNKGVDISVERYLHNGLYFLFTASLFDSKYTAADGVERNTRYNKNWVCNVVAGKEWHLRKNKNKIMGVNVRCNYMGGNRIEPVDQALTVQDKRVVYGESDGSLAFEDKFSDLPILSFTLSYRNNKPAYSSVWSLQILNATQTEEFVGDYYNLKAGKAEARNEGIMVPSISYKIEF